MEFLTFCERFIEERVPTFIRDSRALVRLVLFVTFAGLFVLMVKGAELFPDEGVEKATFLLEFPTGQTVSATEREVQVLEKEFLARPGIQSIATVLATHGPNTAELYVAVTPQNSKRVLEYISSRFQAVPGLKGTRLSEGASSRTEPIVVLLENESLEKLRITSYAVTAALRQVKGIKNLYSNISELVSELEVEMSKERLNRYGLDAQQFVAPLKNLLSDQRVGPLQLGGEDVVARVHSAPGATASGAGVELVRNFSITKEGTGKVFLSEVAEITQRKSPAIIMREDRRRVARISIETDNTDLSTASARISAVLKNTVIDRNVRWSITGEEQERKESQKGLLIAVALSLFLVYILLASQFESLIQPLIILTAVPLCLSGIALGLIVFQMNISAMVLIGLIILIGASINTSIIMVEYANQLLEQGLSASEAIVQATKRRIRPIIVTTSSNILGLVPMVFSYESGAAMQRPLAVALIGGLLSSTLLTVLVVPVVYTRLTRSKNN